METVIDSKKIPEGTQFIEAGCGEKGFRKFEKGCWWFYEGFWRHVDWKMGTLTPVTEHPDYAAKSTPWTGEGLPPVGTVCEFMKHNAEPVPDGKWTVGDIRYVSDCYVIIGGNGCEHAHHPRNCSFRPVRTPDQIEADEREKELQDFTHQIYLDVGMEPRDAELLFNRGYRKQVQP